MVQTEIDCMALLNYCYNIDEIEIRVKTGRYRMSSINATVFNFSSFECGVYSRAAFF